MAFTVTKYEADNEEIHPIRLNSARVAAAGTPPTGAQTSDAYVKISKSNRQFGIRPRGLRLTRTVGTAPDTFKKYTFLPILTQAAFAANTSSVGATVTIGTVSWTVAAKLGEDF